MSTNKSAKLLSIKYHLYHYYNKVVHNMEHFATNPVKRQTKDNVEKRHPYTITVILFSCIFF